MRRAGLIERRSIVVPQLRWRAAAFAPSDIVGLIAWFDLQDPTAFTQVADVITGVTNKASSVVWNTGTLPAYAATGLNGFPCMDLNGTTMSITSTEAAVFGALNDAADYTIFVVSSLDTVDRLEAIFATGNSGVSSNQTRVWGQSNAAAGAYRSFTQNDAGTAVTVLGATLPTTDAAVLCWHSPGTTVSGEINGAPDVTDGAQDPGTLTANRSCIGARPDVVPDGFFDGQIGEIVAYGVKLTAGEIDQVTAYLGTKWSITIP